MQLNAYSMAALIFSRPGYPVCVSVGRCIINLIRADNTEAAHIREYRNKIEETDKARVKSAPALLTAHMHTYQYRIGDKYKNQKKFHIKS